MQMCDIGEFYNVKYSLIIVAGRYLLKRNKFKLKDH